MGQFFVAVIFLCGRLAAAAPKRKGDQDALLEDLFVGLSPDLIYHATSHLKSVVDACVHFDEASSIRDLDVLDLFAGSGRVGSFFAQAGFNTESYDVRLNVEDNILSSRGFGKALELALRLRSQGICIAGPPCSIWVYLSLSYHERSNSMPQGNCSRHKVVWSNILASNLAVLLTIIVLRQGYYIVEQPHSSRLATHFALKTLLTQSHRSFSWLKAFGLQMPKPTQLWSNAVSAPRLQRTWSALREAWAMKTGRWDEAFRSDMKITPGMVDPSEVKQAKENKNADVEPFVKKTFWVTGTKRLQESAEYPLRFVEAMLQCYLEAQRPEEDDLVPLDRLEYNHALAWRGCFDAEEALKWHTLVPEEEPRKRNKTPTTELSGPPGKRQSQLSFCSASEIEAVQTAREAGSSKDGDVVEDEVVWDPYMEACIVV